MELLDWVCLCSIIAVCVLSGRRGKVESQKISIGEPMPPAVLIARMAAIAAAQDIRKQSARTATPIGEQLVNFVSLSDGSGLVEFTCEPRQARLEIVNWIHDQAWGPRYRRRVDVLLDQKMLPIIIDCHVRTWCHAAQQAVPHN